MANAFSKDQTVFFEEVLAGFDPNNITARNVSSYRPPMQTMERSGLTVNRPQPYISTTVTGRDVAGQYKDLNQLSVPSSLTEADIHNVPFTLNALELNDPQQRTRKAMSAVQALSASIDRRVATKVGQQGSMVVTDSAAITTYDQAAVAEALLQENDIAIEQARTMIFNPRDGAGMSGNIANRDNFDGRPMTAYERSALSPVAGFESLRASFMPRIAAAAGGGAITVTGAQSYVPLATDGNGLNVDNRYMNLVVSTTASVAVGDAFTIAGVNALSHINKQDTGQLKTFRVTEVVDGTNLTITPPIVQGSATQAELEYANSTDEAANAAAIVFLNTVSTQANIFFMQDSVEIIHGSLAVDDMGPAVSVMRETTDSGIEILFARQGEIDDLSARYRLTMWANPNVLNTEMCGVLLGNQT